MDPDTPPSPDRAGTSCLSCGYDLTGLALAALCPECAYPVARSRDRSALLRGADPRWLSQIRRGLGDLARAGMVLMVSFIGISIVLFVVIGIAALTGSDIGDAWLDAIAWTLLLGAGLAAAVLHVRGCFLVTTPTHGGYAPARWARLAVRYGGCALVLTAGYTLVWRFAPAWPEWAIKMQRAVFQANAIWFFFGLADVLMSLERRTPDASALAKTVRARLRESAETKRRNTRKNLYGVIILLVIFYWLPNPFRGAIPARHWGEWIFGLVYLFMAHALGRLAKVIAEELRVAEAERLPASEMRVGGSEGRGATRRPSGGGAD